MPEQTLENSSFSGLTTNILLEPNFAGNFEGAISQFRMYTKPLSYPEVVHNFELNVNKFNMFNHRCPDCTDTLVNDISFTVSDNTIIFDSELFANYNFDFSALPNGEVYRVGQSEDNSFPYPYNPTNDGNGTYYFYFPDIDQTLSLYSLNIPSSHFNNDSKSLSITFISNLLNVSASGVCEACVLVSKIASLISKISLFVLSSQRFMKNSAERSSLS